MEQLSIYLLGSFEVRLGDQDLGGVFRTRKERALLAYLAVESRHPLRREALAELLWPERPEITTDAQLKDHPTRVFRRGMVRMVVVGED